MLDFSLILFVAGLSLILGLSKIASKGSFEKFYKQYLSFSNPPSPQASRKLTYSNDELPKPTPLMITPEQVKNYDDRPWRPFRWPYHQTMSIFKLDINHWLDMDKYYWHYIQEKERIIMKYGNQNIDCLPEGYDAAVELMEIVTDHMLIRYPLLFILVEDRGSKGKIVKNLLTSETLDMTLPLKEQPLVYVSKMAKEDFYIVKKNPKDDLHYLVAAAVPFPGGSFGVNEKIGKHMDVIHEDVPYYKEKLQKSMERWMNKMSVGDPVERASWYISWDHKLKINSVYQIPKLKKDIEAEMKSSEPMDFNVRVERQTLRRLPKSRAIIFTNHPVFYSIEEMKDEPMIPSLLKKIIYEGPRDIVKYKNFEFFRDHISNYLDGLINRQISKGIIKEDDPVKTQPSYPFAYWTKTNFDTSNGWNNPSESYSKEKSNYTERAKKERYYHND
ncbi:uncharacterized protein PRCAT00000670001 [Priceomyces carsonii]|uniref:uncharacterized protein n=1 Tax=Priceomyces carsonii TaxID=28549 RepID=UPI002EDAF1EE|nr:unnamed protein product [Priceomyces carsonii]